MKRVPSATCSAECGLPLAEGCVVRGMVGAVTQPCRQTGEGRSGWVSERARTVRDRGLAGVGGCGMGDEEGASPCSESYLRTMAWLEGGSIHWA